MKMKEGGINQYEDKNTYDLESIFCDGYDVDWNARVCWINITEENDRYLNASIIDEDMIAIIKEEADENKVYQPKKLHANDWEINIYLNKLNELESYYYKSVIAVKNVLKTPQEKADNAAFHRINVGIMDYEDIEAQRIMDKVLNYANYHNAINMMESMFFMFFAATVNTLLHQFAKKSGYQGEDKKSKIIKYINSKFNIKFEELERKSFFNEVNAIGNFMKHTSIATYNAVKKLSSATLLNDFQENSFFLNLIQITEDFTLKCINNIKEFFKELITKCFNEDVERAQWDYMDYFLNKIKADEDSSDPFNW